MGEVDVLEVRRKRSWWFRRHMTVRFRTRAHCTNTPIWKAPHARDEGGIRYWVVIEISLLDKRFPALAHCDAVLSSIADCGLRLED
jgi:hypothetical protein